MAKIQPSVLNIRFEFSQGDPTTQYIDISQCASLVNRRFYRQGLSWAVAGFTVYAQTGTVGSLTIGKLPQTWMCSNSWHKIFAAWQKQQREALKDAGGQSTKATWNDFKIHMNAEHVANGFAANEVPVDFLKVPYIKGEWDPSQIVIPNEGGVIGNTQEFFLHMAGQDIPTSFGMISNYSVSRAFPQSPDPVESNPQTGLLSEMFNVGMDDVEVVENATDRNDELPYPQANYPGGGLQAPTIEMLHQTFIDASTFHRVRQLSGASIPCGLLEIKASFDGPCELWIHLVPGPSRGYLTQPMQDM